MAIAVAKEEITNIGSGIKDGPCIISVALITWAKNQLWTHKMFSDLFSGLQLLVRSYIC